MTAVLEQRKTQLITQIARLENAQLLDLIERLLALDSPQPAPAGHITDDEISGNEIAELLVGGRSFAFLENEEEDIYSDADLKVTY